MYSTIWDLYFAKDQLGLSIAEVTTTIIQEFMETMTRLGDKLDNQLWSCWPGKKENKKWSSYGTAMNIAFMGT